MELINQTTEFHIDEPCAVAIGKFDGIHLGHRALLSEVLAARKQGLKTAVFTFDPSPGAYFRSLSIEPLGPFRELLTVEEKRSLFEEMGIDYLVEYPFGRDTAAVMPEDYVNRFLLDQMHARLIVAGEDVSFGRNGAGDAETLEELAEAYNMDPARDASDRVSIRIIPKVCLGGREISSTLVRECVHEGDMEKAAEYLGQPFVIRGMVQRGNRIGHSLGMPTANLYPKENKLLPPNGVYFSESVTQDGLIRRGITNIGSKPTIGEAVPRISVETYLFDFDQELYDRTLEVQILHFCRAEQKFFGLDELREQMQKDADACRAYFEK
ncbi:MAG: riboflavin biosynthesis protein RibF [Lachnospiraceae bacterium]|nr:riboflavin biosynthesis protein RibF [Lachnospiraceae bacterium]